MSLAVMIDTNRSADVTLKGDDEEFILNKRKNTQVIRSTLVLNLSPFFLRLITHLEVFLIFSQKASTGSANQRRDKVISSENTKRSIHILINQVGVTL